ncbi:DUF2500 domain-containing protein [Paenibacillus dokdonensis]|uniref:DUF2500 domain-containing protein n=1 Tax=Paenibacillus dokdonensis TaxID=2567944 RepID=A0ABU6GRU8_9BACL|nr:DUF2500 domain-containing protein [Paenibacillus dokdonensis]MEC0242491.1 DUF2500 domain-containing protein [Paenibacillus dokdonensis]
MISPGPSFGGGFNFMFTLVPILIGIGFVFIIIVFILNGARYIKNARSPRSSTYARIVSKRTELHHNSSHHHDDNGIMHSGGSSRTYYYITLEFDNGERKEYLDVKKLYGLVAEGDTGYAAIQGDWIVAFERGV